MLAVCVATSAQTTNGGITEQMLSKIEKAGTSMPQSKALFNAVAANNIDELAKNFDNGGEIDTYFSIETPKQTIHDQKSSGRCWMFSGLNVLRSNFARRHNDTLRVEYSHAYLFFYDQLEKANLMLQGTIDNASKPIDDQRVQFFFHHPINDGGTFCGVSDLAEKYGLVPMSVMPETYSANNTSRMAKLISSKLREFGLELRQMVADGKSKSQIEARKTDMLGTIYQMLTLTIGTPVKSFTYAFKNKDGKTVTPVNAITTFSYANSNPSAAIVDSTGRITAKAPGTTNITVKSANGKALIITVNVAAKPAALAGDVDGDGIVTSADSAVLGNYTSGIYSDKITAANSDVTGDGKITALDRIVLTRYVDRMSGYTALPHGAAGTAANGAAFSVDTAKTDEFGEVEIGINLTKNPGIATADFDIEFNSNVLELTEVVDNQLFEGAVAAHSDKMQSPYRLSWQNDVTQSDSSATGKLVTLRFKVKENAEPGVYDITVNPNTAEVYNSGLYFVPCTFTNGAVEVEDSTVPKTGDVDRSGTVDADDALLLQKHIARFTDGGSPLLDESDEETMTIADVNRDGSLTVGDVTMIQQYIAEIIEF